MSEGGATPGSAREAGRGTGRTSLAARAVEAAKALPRLGKRPGALAVLLRKRRARVGLLGLTLLLVLAGLAGWLVDPLHVDAAARLSGPNGAHWLGTDASGHDVLARLVYGTRAAVVVGGTAAALVTVLGVVLGALSGFYGGRVDSLITRLVEVLLSVPSIVAVLALRGITGDTRLLDVAIVFGLLRWTDVARLTRAEVLRARSADWAIAAHALGLPPRRVLLRHVLPDAIAPALVAMPLAMATAVVIDASLAALGASPHGMPSWGQVMSGARDHHDAWWLALFPGLALSLAVASLNLVGESLRDALDPQLRSLPGSGESG